MTSLDSKLFAWQRLHMQCQTARVRLKEAMGSAAADGVVEALHAEVQRLQDEMETLLRQIDALRRGRPPGPAQPEH